MAHRSVSTPMVLCIRENDCGVPAGVHKVEPIDYHPFEPSAYCWDAGWSAEINGAEIYISESGDVYAGPTCETAVGVCEALREMWQSPI